MPQPQTHLFPTPLGADRALSPGPALAHIKVVACDLIRAITASRVAAAPETARRRWTSGLLLRLHRPTGTLPAAKSATAQITLTLAATDGIRCALFRLPDAEIRLTSAIANLSPNATQALVPYAVLSPDAANKILNALATAPSSFSVSLAIHAQAVTLDTGTLRLTVLSLPDAYPDYERIVRRPFDLAVTVDLFGLIAAILDAAPAWRSDAEPPSDSQATLTVVGEPDSTDRALAISIGDHAATIPLLPEAPSSLPPPVQPMRPEPAPHGASVMIGVDQLLTLLRAATVPNVQISWQVVPLDATPDVPLLALTDPLDPRSLWLLAQHRSDQSKTW
jgi:hypothetical protein